MVVRKSPISSIELDEFARELREFESLRAKSLTAGAKERVRMVGGKHPRSHRESACDQPASTSFVHSHQRAMEGSAKKVNIDDLERQLRELASSALRKSRAPSEKGDLRVEQIKQLGGIIGGSMESRGIGATSHPGLLQPSWRPVILRTYGEQSLVWRCARSLALPLLLLSLGAGALVVFSPDGALNTLDRLLEDAQAKQAIADNQMPAQRAVTGPSFDQPSRSSVLAESPAAAVTSPVGQLVGGTGLTHPPASVGGPSVNAGLGFTDHDISELVPVGVARDDPPIRFSLPSTKQILDGGAAPDAARSAQEQVVDATKSRNTDAESSAGSSKGEVGFEALSPFTLDAATSQASISSPTGEFSTSDAAALSSFAIESGDINSKSPDNAVAENPASISADLATLELNRPLPSTTPREAGSVSPAGSSNEQESGSSNEAFSEAPTTVVAGFVTPPASVSLPSVTRSPTPDAAGATPLANDSGNLKPGSTSDARSMDPTIESATWTTPETRSQPTTLDEPSSSLLADRSVEAKTHSGAAVSKAPVLEAPGAVATNSALSQTSIPLPAVASSPAPTASASATPNRVDLRTHATEEGVSPLPSAAMPAPTERAASGRTEIDQTGRNTANDESLRASQSSDAQTVFGAAEHSAMPAAPVLSFNNASPANTFAQVVPGLIERAESPGAELIVPRKETGATGAALPLPISLNSAPAGAMVVIHGLATGSTLSVGQPLELDGWQLTAAELHEAVLRPPQGFAGVMELSLELRLANDSIADRKTLHLEWTGITEPQTTRTAGVIRHLDSDEVSALLKRGEGFIARGDLASARLLLQRAAEAGDAEAALSLAGTFDPIILDRLGLKGQKADIEKARLWYQRAQELGSAAAPKRLQLLATYDQ